MFVVANSQLQHLQYYLNQVKTRLGVITSSIDSDVKASGAEATDAASALKEKVEGIFTHITNAGAGIEDALQHITTSTAPVATTVAVSTSPAAKAAAASGATTAAAAAPQAAVEPTVPAQASPTATAAVKAATTPKPSVIVKPPVPKS